MTRAAFYTASAIVIALASHLSAGEPDAAPDLEAQVGATTAPQAAPVETAPLFDNTSFASPSLEGFTDSRWYEREGADGQGDLDPRGSMMIERPTPQIVLDLRY